ncbi:MAG: FtsX-like permease family protein [Acidimicrobiales bacterium]
MKNLALKRRRDIRRQKWQFIAVLVTVVLGVSMFAGTFNAYLNLGSSLDGSYDRLAMADMTVTGGDETLAESLATLEGVETAITRSQIDVPFEIGDYTFLGRVVGMPPDDQPEINMVDIDDGGTYLDPDDPTAVVLESHAAKDFDLSVGDTFLIAGQEVEVAGIGVSTEYLWPARDSQNIFTPPKSFGVAFVHEDILEQLDTPARVDQVLVLYKDDVDVEAVDEAVEDAALTGGASEVQTLEEQPSNFTINEEISALRTMAIALPLLFLVAAGMAIYVVITRLVYSQRGVIGTLRASGFTRRQMSSHYRSYGVSVGIIGAVIGIVFGSFMARGLTAIYTKVFGIPDLVAEFHLPTVAMALVFGAVAGLIAAVPPAREVAKMAPAEAMRGDTPAAGGRRSIFETLIPPLRNAPVRWRMSLRGIGRNKKRSTSMVIGVVLGMTLILASWGMIDTMLLAIDRQFNEVAIEDANVVFATPIGESEVALVEGVDGVSVAEAVVSLQAVVGREGETLSTALEAYQVGTEVHGFDPDLPAEGALLGEAMRDILEVSEGDRVTIDLVSLDTSIEATVSGFVDEPLGTVAYLSQSALVDALAATDPSVTAETLAEPSFTTIKARFDDGADAELVLAGIKDVEGVAAAIDSAELRGLIEDFQIFFYVFVGIMVLFGGAMAFALIFNIISVNVAERSGEFASMRANGLTHRRVASLIVGETGLLTAMGIVPGLIVGYLAALAFVGSFSSAEFPISAELRPLSFVGATVAMFVVAGLSLIPALKAVKRINVGEIVRERST